MMFKASLFLGLASFLAVLGSQIDAASGAPIEDVLKSLKGLSAKERLARVESEARKEGSVRLGVVDATSVGRACPAGIPEALPDDSSRVHAPERQGTCGKNCA